MKWNQKNSINRDLPWKFQVPIISFDLCLWSQTFPPNVDAASATHSPLLRPPENSKRKGTMSRSLYQGWQGSDRTGWKQEDSLGGLCPESVYPGWLASKKVLTFSTSWCDTCDIKCVSWGAGKTCGGARPSTLCNPLHPAFTMFSAPSGGQASPGFRQVPGPALQQLLRLQDLCLAACSPPDSHIPGGEPRAGSEKYVVLLSS